MRVFDVAIIGGGITGAGIALDAAMRGWKTVLIEQNAFGGRTTLISTGLIHGGLRYQETDTKITKLSCLDSGVILKIAPFLLTRQPFIVPITKENRHSLLAWDIFLEAYDEFQPLKGGKKHVRLSKEEVGELEPNIKKEIEGAVVFDEWKVDPLKLVLANLGAAKYYGATLLEHTEVLEINKRTKTVMIDNGRGDGEILKAKAIVNATGPFAEATAQKFGGKVRLRMTKGSHITVNKRLSNNGVVTLAKDTKPVFIIPERETTTIGPTNIMFYGKPNKVEISEDEREYLLEILNSVFLTPVDADNVIKSISGVRPQLYHWGVADEDVSHDYAIYDHAKDGAEGIFTIVGGKMSMYRKMAQEMTDVVGDYLGRKRESRTHLEKLPEISDEAMLNFENWEIQKPELVANPVYVPMTHLALKSHEEAGKISKKKKILAKMRLAKFAIWHWGKILKRKKSGIQLFKENYGETK